MVFRSPVQTIRRLSTNQKKFRSQLAADPARETYYKTLGDKDSQNNDTKPEGWDQAKPYSSIPGPNPLPIVGNLWRFMPGGEFYKMSMIDMLSSLRSQYGEIVLLGGIPSKKDQIAIFNPDLTETLLRNDGVYPIRPSLYSFQYYREHIRKDVFQGVGGLATVNGEDWFKVRSVVNKILMQPRTAEMYVTTMDEVANEFVDNIRYFSQKNPNHEMPEDFQNEIYKWTLESVGVVAYNKRLGCLKRNMSEEGQRMINNSVEILNLMYKLDFRPSLWKYVSTKDWRNYVKLLDFLTFTNIKYIEACLEDINNRKIDLPESEQSVLERLTKSDKKIAIAMAIDLVTAGVDTTGKTAATVLYFLAKNPEKQEQLRQEIKTYLPHKNSPVTKEMLQQAPYLKAVIKEASRIAPVAIGTSRITVKDLVIKGYQIPKGTEVMSPNIILSNEERHFKDAKSFIPERWLRDVHDEYSAKNVHPFVSLPFGFGSRSCVGKRLANLELEVGIAKMIRNFKFIWPHKDAKFSITLLYGIVDPLKFRVEEAEH